MSNPNRPRYRTLSEELEQLERVDPAVRAASEAYDRTVDEILADRERCEHGLRRPCEECDPFVFSRRQQQTGS